MSQDAAAPGTARTKTRLAPARLPYQSVVVIGLAVAVGLTSLMAPPPVAAQPQNASQRMALYDFNIPAGELSSGIATLGAITGLVIVVDADRLERTRTQGVQGRYNVDAALGRLLYGTGLSHRFLSDNRVRLVAAPASRMSQQSQVSALRPVTVKASRNAKDDTYATPASVSVITREDMDRMVVRNVGDALEGTPGVFVKNDRSSTALVVNIRGLEGRQRVTVSIDGARQNFQKSGHGFTEGEVYLDPDLLARVDVSKGVSTGVGGAGAIAGVVDFRTLNADDLLRPGQNLGGRITLGSGSNGYHFQGSAAVAQRLGDSLELVGGISRRNIGAFRHGTRHSERNPVNAGASAITEQKSLSGLFKAAWHPGEGNQVQLSYVGYATDGAAADLGSPSSNGWKVDSHTLTLGLDRNPADSDWLNLSSRLYYVSTRYDQRLGLNQGSSGYGTQDIRYQTETLGISATNKSRWQALPSLLLEFSYGGEAFHDWTSPGFTSTGNAEARWYTGPTPEGKRTVAGLFGEIAASHNSGLQLIAGLRYDWYRVSGNGDYQICYRDPNDQYQQRPCLRTNEAGVRPQYTSIYTNFRSRRQAAMPLPKVTLAYAPPSLSGLQVYATYGMGMRPPTITEMLFHGGHVGNTMSFIPNPGLIEEQSRNAEIGANLMLDGVLTTNDRLRMKAAVFDNRIRHNIDVAPVLGPTSTAATVLQADNAYVNFSGTHHWRGLELALEYDAGIVFGSLNWTRLRRKDNEGGTYRLYPLGSQVGYPVQNFEDLQHLLGRLAWSYGSANLPEASGTLSLGMRLFDQRLTVGWRMRQQRFKNYHYIDAMANWNVHDAWVAWKPTPRSEIRLTVNNLMDLVYGEITQSGVAARRISPGRTALLTAAWSF